MTTPLIPGWVTVDLVCLSQATGAMTTFTYVSDPDDEITELQMTDFLTAWKTRMLTYLQNVFSTQVAINLVRGTTRFPAHPNVEVESNFPVGTFGIASGDPLPNNAACVVKYLTGRVGRTRRGRQYIFGMSEIHATGNSFTSTYTAAVASLVAQHMAGFTVDGVAYKPGVASRKDLAVRLVSSTVVNPLVRTQRRRLPRNSIFAF